MPEPSGGRYTAIVEKVLYDAANPNRLLAFGGTSRNWNEADSFGWIWESTDGGENWRHIGTISEDGFPPKPRRAPTSTVCSMSRVPKRGCIAHRRGNWFISDDNGTHLAPHQPQGLPTKLARSRFIQRMPTSSG
jgi:hypothetical protein